jgi:hypothetical protein
MAKKAKNEEERLEPTAKTQLAIWVTGGGRCTFCNE